MAFLHAKLLFPISEKLVLSRLSLHFIWKPQGVEAPVDLQSALALSGNVGNLGAILSPNPEPQTFLPVKLSAPYLCIIVPSAVGHLGKHGSINALYNGSLQRLVRG